MTLNNTKLLPHQKMEMLTPAKVERAKQDDNKKKTY